MKRDMEVVRKILLTVEQYGPPQGFLKLTPDDGRTADELAYHVKLLHDHGLLEAVDMSTHGGLAWHPKRLTWEGHEFLDAIRNDTVWAKTKTAIADKGGSIPFEVLKELAIKFARDLFLGGS